MARSLMCVITTLVAFVIAVAGCTQPAAAPTPTKALAAPTKAPAAPTKAEAAPTKPAASPTAVAAAPTKAPTAAAAEPAKKVDYPAKGRAISVVVPFAAGGSNDVMVRLLTPILERELGAPFEVLNKAGAAGQIGYTEVGLAKPDGYTMGTVALPSIILLYKDPRRKAVFNRSTLQPVGMHVRDPHVIGVPADSPFKTFKDMADAAKAKPGSVKVATTGLGTPSHPALLLLERLIGTKFAIVHFDGDAPALAGLLGGHVDAACSGVRSFMPHVKSGRAKVLAIMDKEETKHYPGVKTLESFGYKLYYPVNRGYMVPAGTPKEIVDLLAKALKTATDNPEHVKKMEEAGLDVVYMGPAESAALWVEQESQVDPLMSEILEGN